MRSSPPSARTFACPTSASASSPTRSICRCVDRAGRAGGRSARSRRAPGIGRRRDGAAQRGPPRGEQGLPRPRRGARRARNATVPVAGRPLALGDRRRGPVSRRGWSVRLRPRGLARCHPARRPGRRSRRCTRGTRRATLFVHPTLYEGSSLVTLEAMAHRRAVVATNAGGLPDKVRPGVNGWLVAPGDPAALAAAISGVAGDTRTLDALWGRRPRHRRARVLLGCCGQGHAAALRRAARVASRAGINHE